MRLPPLNALPMFEAAGRLQSFKRAAEELHLTPSAVSHGIAGLEKWLGVPLFDRAPGQVALTLAGARYLPPVQQALELVATATQAMPGRGPGRVVLSVAPTFALRWLIPRLDDFRALHPEVNLVIDTRHEQVAATDRGRGSRGGPARRRARSLAAGFDGILVSYDPGDPSTPRSRFFQDLARRSSQA